MAKHVNAKCVICRTASIWVSRKCYFLHEFNMGVVICHRANKLHFYSTMVLSMSNVNADVGGDLFLVRGVRR